MKSFDPTFYLEYCNDCSKNIQILPFGDKVLFSTKIDAILKVLIKNQKAGLKTIVFSQFTNSLSLLENGLSKINLKFIRFDGTLSSVQRSQALSNFKATNVSILTASLRATATGLNIVEASEIVFFDQWWNPTVEDQAIARVHRIGQTRQVGVTRFVVKNTIEEAILKIQQRKVHLIN